MIKVIKLNNQVIQSATQETILESLEAVGLEMKYHCREGICGHCRCRLVCGEVTYQFAPLACVKKNEVLICTASALTDIEIAIV